MFITIGTIGIDTPILGCRACGALVCHDLMDKHIAFHAEVLDLLERNACA